MADKNLAEIEVPYGSERVSVRLPEANLAAVIKPNSFPIRDEITTVRAALSEPIDSEPFSDFVSHPGDRTLIIVNDATRPTPTARVLPSLLELAGQADLSLIVATGTHGHPKPEEMAWIFGDLLDGISGRVFVHDCRNANDMRQVGVTSRGTVVSLNRLALEADRLVVLSSVEPHYFAGYTGGRKSILPGLAAFETVEQNHSLALEPGVVPLALSGNPVHEDMVEAVSFLGDKPIFNINLVLDEHDRIYAATAGDLSASFMAGVEKANEVYVAPIREPVDVVVSVAGYPLDRDLYQLQKALEHGLVALKDGGVLVLVSKCWDGVGEDSYLDPVRRLGDPARVIEHVGTHKSFGCHKAGRLARAALRVKLFAVTDLDPAVVKTAFMQPFASLQKALNSALHLAGPDAQVLFLMNASLCVPKVELPTLEL